MLVFCLFVLLVKDSLDIQLVYLLSVLISTYVSCHHFPVKGYYNWFLF